MKSFTFGRGKHKTREEGMCIMEAVAFIEGLPHSDHPPCTSTILTRLMIAKNDSISDDETRLELLYPFIYRLPGTIDNEKTLKARLELMLKWLISIDEVLEKSKQHFRNIRSQEEIGTVLSLLMDCPLVDQSFLRQLQSNITKNITRLPSSRYDTFDIAVEESFFSLIDELINVTEIKENDTSNSLRNRAILLPVGK